MKRGGMKKRKRGMESIKVWYERGKRDGKLKGERIKRIKKGGVVEEGRMGGRGRGNGRRKIGKEGRE